jgi:uracil phosphoribosyltransferase
MFILNQQASIAGEYLANLRSVDHQNDRFRFRANLERLGMLLAYEISKKLPAKEREVETPLGLAKEWSCDSPVLIPILRAGLPFYQGFLQMFDEADSGFIGAFRAPHQTAEDIEIELTYRTLPPLAGRTLILLDPMLATGKSMVQSIEGLIAQGNEPQHIHIAVVIAAPEGVKFLEENLKVPYTLWTVAIDDCLNDKAYIVPGLGDAGDLSFGQKL